MKKRPPRKNGGFTLAELLTVLLLLSLFASASSSLVRASKRSGEASALISRLDAVSDTLNAKLAGFLSCSACTKSGGETRFLSEKYSGFELSFRCENGRITVSGFENKDGPSRELLPESAYCGFEVSELCVAYSGGLYTVSYRLSSGAFSRRSEFTLRGDSFDESS